MAPHPRPPETAAAQSPRSQQEITPRRRHRDRRPRSEESGGRRGAGCGGWGRGRIGEGSKGPVPEKRRRKWSAGMEPSRKGEANACRVVRRPLTDATTPPPAAARRPARAKESYRYMRYDARRFKKAARSISAQATTRSRTSPLRKAHIVDRFTRRFWMFSGLNWSR